jgi:DNA (cytosine-5)-methyltransferase 1
MLTVQELKRIQSLPDDFILTGSQSQQTERVGRMVPPLMMKAIAENIYKEVLSKL